MKRIALPTNTRTLLGALAACAVLAVLGSMPAPAALASPLYPAPYVSPLLAAETEALTRQGISTERANQAIQVQSEIAQTELIPKIETALGSSYAGVWFEPTTAQLHVGIVSPAAGRTAEQVAANAHLSSQVVETPVASTWAQLSSTEARWSARLAALPGPMKVALAPQSNAVVVTLSTELAATQRSALEREASLSPVGVRISTVPPQQLEIKADRQGKCKSFTKGTAYCERPIASGVNILDPNNAACTAGPLAIGRGGEQNKTFVLTAGHCIDAKGEEWFARTPGEAKGKLGNAIEFVAGNGRIGDYGDIQVEQPGFWAQAGATPVFALTAEWKLTNDSTTSYPIRGERASEVGFTNCHEGQTTGQTCGQVKALQVKVTYDKGLKIAGLVEDKGASRDEGDSGGPWLFIESNNEVLMEGIHSGGTGTTSFYTPVQTALNALNLELLTSANEVRKGFVAKNPPVKISGVNKGVHVFESGGGGTVECESASSTANAAQSLLQTLSTTVKYAKCFGTFAFIKRPAEISQAEYLFERSGHVTVENTIVIKAAEKTCEITITPTNNKELGTVTYANVGTSPKEVEIKAEVEGFSEETKGPSEICGKSSKAGKYKGIEIAKAEVGDIEVS
ncbi:MAG: S1 family peptidase [Solirubrobacterales bacterium]